MLEKMSSSVVTLSGEYAADLEMARNLRNAAQSLAWAVGDYFNAMYERYEGSQRSLERDVADAIEIPATTLREYARVARTFPVDDRSSNMSFTHHAKASVSEHPVQVLTVAEAQGLSTRDTERLAKGLPLGGEATAAAQSSVAASGASLEEAAVESVVLATVHLNRAVGVIKSQGFRMTIPVAQTLAARLQEAATNYLIIEKAVEAEIGSLT